MNTIELTKEIAEHFMKTRYEFTGYCPFEGDFAITFPATVCLDSTMLKLAKAVKGYSPKYNCVFNISDTTIITKVYFDNDLLIDFTVGENGIVYDKEQESKEIQNGLLAIVINILAATIYQLSIPSVEKKIELVRERKPNGKSIYMSNSKKYIYKTKYTFKSIATPKKLTKHTESWSVMGHFRHFKNEKGEIYKKTWIHPYTKGNGTPKENSYKITRL